MNGMERAKLEEKKEMNRLIEERCWVHCAEVFDERDLPDSILARGEMSLVDWQNMVDEEARYLARIMAVDNHYLERNEKRVMERVDESVRARIGKAVMEQMRWGYYVVDGRVLLFSFDLWADAEVVLRERGRRVSDWLEYAPDEMLHDLSRMLRLMYRVDVVLDLRFVRDVKWREERLGCDPEKYDEADWERFYDAIKRVFYDRWEEWLEEMIDRGWRS